MRESETQRGRSVNMSRALTNRVFEDPDLMAQSHDLELEVKARTKDRTQCDEKCEQGSGHQRREFGEQYNSFPLGSFRIFERHKYSMSKSDVNRRELPFARAANGSLFIEKPRIFGTVHELTVGCTTQRLYVVNGHLGP
jgi:hypothetical protein